MLFFYLPRTSSLFFAVPLFSPRVFFSHASDSHERFSPHLSVLLIEERPFDSSSSFYLPAYNNFTSSTIDVLHSSLLCNILLALTLTSRRSLSCIRPYIVLRFSPSWGTQSSRILIARTQHERTTDVCLLEISRRPRRTRSFQLHRVQRERTCAPSSFRFGIAFLVILFSHSAACALFFGFFLTLRLFPLAVGSSVSKAVSFSPSNKENPHVVAVPLITNT